MATPNIAANAAAAAFGWVIPGSPGDQNENAIG